MINRMEKNTTLILPCRKGDVLVWLRLNGNPFQGSLEYQIADLWVLNDGDQVLLTNRLEDVPDWLPIFPTKVTGRNTWVMMAWLDQGHDPFSKQVNLDNLQNVWKVNSSHYLIWLGKSRPDLESANGFMESQNGVLRILLSTCGTLAIHQPKNQSDFFLQNGQVLNLHKEYLNTEARASINWAIEAVKAKGMPRSFSHAWKLG